MSSLLLWFLSYEAFAFGHGVACCLVLSTSSLWLGKCPEVPLFLWGFLLSCPPYAASPGFGPCLVLIALSLNSKVHWKIAFGSGTVCPILSSLSALVQTSRSHQMPRWTIKFYYLSLRSAAAVRSENSNRFFLSLKDCFHSKKKRLSCWSPALKCFQGSFPGWSMLSFNCLELKCSFPCSLLLTWLTGFLHQHCRRTLHKFTLMWGQKISNPFIVGSGLWETVLHPRSIGHHLCSHEDKVLLLLPSTAEVERFPGLPGQQVKTKYTAWVELYSSKILRLFLLFYPSFQ